MNYDFDVVYDRRDTGSIKWDKYVDQDVIPLWVADMDFAIAPEIQQALTDRLQHPVFGYTHATDKLYDNLLAHLQSVYQWKVERDWIVWIPGVVPAMAAAVRAYVPDGSDIITNPPIYHHFFQVHDPEKHRLVKVPLVVKDGRWTYDLDAMAKAATQQTSIFMLCSPHNPTGTLFTSSELEEVCKIAASCNAVIVSDEIHCGLVLSKQQTHIPTAIAAGQHAKSVVTLMSASKTFNLAGLNCSYAIIEDEQLRDKFEKACEEVVPLVGSLAFSATEAAFGAAEPWRLQLLDYLRGNYNYLQQSFAAIDGMDLHPLDATYLAWIDASGLNLNDACSFFEQHGVGFSSGEQFGQPHYLRLNFACTRATLEEAMSRVQKAVKSL